MGPNLDEFYMIRVGRTWKSVFKGGRKFHGERGIRIKDWSPPIGNRFGVGEFPGRTFHKGGPKGVLGGRTLLKGVFWKGVWKSSTRGGAPF